MITSESFTNKKICLVAGKSGGHIIPAITYAQNLLKSKKCTKSIFFTTNSKLDCNLITQSEWIDHHVALDLPSFPKKDIFKYPNFIYKFITSILQTFFHLNKNKPDIIISMAGYISIPVCISAFILRIPIHLFELNVIPGQATKLIKHIARTVYITFDSTSKMLKHKNIKKIEYPIRFSKTTKRLDIPKHCKVLLILGGSQGSAYINNLITYFVKIHHCKLSNLYIIHQTGSLKDAQIAQETYNSLGVKSLVFDFINDLETYYNSADLVISRAGAGTLFELLFFKKHTFIVPLETAGNNHQVHNATAMSKEYPKLFQYYLQSNIEKNRSQLYSDILKSI